MNLKKHDIALRIKAYRTKELILNQTDFGKLCGVSKAAVSQWENEVTVPERDALMQLQKNKGVDADWILCNTESKTTGEAHKKEIEEMNACYTITGNFTRLPQVKWQDLGTFLNSIYENKELEAMPTNKVEVSEKAFMVEIDHNHYHDYINTGDIAIIDPEVLPEHGRNVLVILNGQPHIMRYEILDTEYLYFIQDTSKSVKITEDIDIMGSIVWIVPAGRKG